jgi:acyl-CoA synthetase (AMP-forming)/AMP-acid ligase II
MRKPAVARGRHRRSAPRFRRGGDGGHCPGALLTEAAILSALAGRLAKFKAPKQVFVVEALLRNAMGKVQKAALREMYRDVYR